MGSGALLAVPACEKGRGGGHLIRCMALVRDLRALGREAWLCAPNNNIIDIGNFNRDWLITETALPNIHWKCIILDRFHTPLEELSRWEQLAPVIGIDEGGPCRNHFDFLIDILPNCFQTKPNIADPSLLPLPNRGVGSRGAAKPHWGIGNTSLKVLVSFGHEDAAGLGVATAQALAAKNSKSIDITLLQGGLGNKGVGSVSIPNLKIITVIPNLSEHLTDYDLVITHYGLTAFEALYAGVPVLLVSPGAYHEKLARKAGFFSCGVGKHGAAQLACLLFKKGELSLSLYDRLKNRCTALAARYHLDTTPQHSLAELINGFTPDLSRNCPVCGAALHSLAIARFSERSYRRCTHCGIISMNRLNPPPVEYGKEYFFENYQKQYGKTYLEDFPHLTAMGKRRLDVIKRLSKKNQPRTTLTRTFGTHTNNKPLLLDIGCAYGPFLAAAQEEGFSPHGIDPAEDAVRYVTHTLGIPAVQGFFPEMGIGDQGSGTGEYNVITLWYVIEHFRGCTPVFVEIHKLLKPGGVLAFATPSFSGISGRASLKRFLKHSPADHWTIWSPAVCRKTLKIAGFRVKKIINSGHHPERFPVLGKCAQSAKSPLYWLLLAMSKIFSLGDTFEVYAVRL